MTRPEDDSRFIGETIFDAAAGVSTIPTVISERLKISRPTPVMVIVGGAGRMDPEIGLRIRTFFERSLAPVLESTGMVVLTGGTESGVMAIAGETLAEVATLVGVSPRGALEDEPGVQIQRDHHVSVLTSGRSWGSETDYMVQLATGLTHGARTGVVLLVNGGPVAFEEINFFIDAGWPILAIEGTGGIADALLNPKRRSDLPALPWSSLGNADVDQVELDGSPSEIRKRLHWYVSRDELLKSAWTYFLALDRSAERQQKFNRRLRVILQVVSLALLSLMLIRFEVREPDRHLPALLSWAGGGAFLSVVENITVPIAVALPIALAGAAAISQSVSADRGWRVLREAAESLKREIYRYRATLVSSAHDERAVEGAVRGLRNEVDAALRGSAASAFLLSVDLTSRRGRPAGLDEGDDELAPLSVASYTSHRVDGQIAYFQKNGRRLRSRALFVVLLGVALAGVSGWLAGTYFAPWAAVAVLGVTAVSAYADRNRLTDRASRYATASADLARIKSELDGQNADSVSQPAALHKAVFDAEAALERESLAWEQLLWRNIRESATTGGSRTRGNSAD